MKRTLIALCVIMLCSPAAMCGTGGRPAVEVPIPPQVIEVAKPCPVKRPERPAPIGALPTALKALAAVLGAKLKEYAAPGAYADKADAAIRTCQHAGQ